MNIKEGFICPQCMKVFDSIQNLQYHFTLCEVEQPNFAKDNSGIVGIIRKAKRTVEEVLNSKNTELFLARTNNLNNKFEKSDFPEQSTGYAFYEEPNIKIQSSGIEIDKTEEFINLRRMKLQSSAIETSNLIIRIEKMISFSANKSGIERKNFEQSVVEWVQDDLVSMCPSCGLKFGLNLSVMPNIDNPIVLSSNDEKDLIVKKPSKLMNTFTHLFNLEIENAGVFIKKRHHCRLCGGLICSNCSFMFPSSEANSLLSAINSRMDLRESLWQGNLKWKEDSQTSLDSIKSKVTHKEYCIRCCGNCKMQIEWKWAQMEQRILDPDIIVMYKELISEINKTAKLISKYQIMSQSISSGETVYSYHEASEMRMYIVTRCQQIDVIGNQFKSKTSTSKGIKEANLFNAISRNALLFLQNNFATLKYLPSEDEFKELVSLKLLKIREEVINKNKKTSNTLTKSYSQNQLVNVGWAPSIKTNGVSLNINSNSNPFEQDNLELSNIALQIENVRRFMDQARDGQRVMDVEILQKNMVDLENEYETLQKKLYS